MNLKLKLALPKGKLYSAVNLLLEEAGFSISKEDRNYRPTCTDKDIEIKILKPQNIPNLIELGSQDIGFTGKDWVVEENADVVEILDLDFDKVKIIVAIPSNLDKSLINKQKIRVASEYELITKAYLKNKKIDFTFIKSFGATEVFVPDDADMIVDNTSSGKTLQENNLKIVDEILLSSTRLFANRESLQNPEKKKKIADLVMLLQSVLDGRKKLLLELNVSNEKFDSVISILPSMKSPTISELYGQKGFAIKTAINKSEVGKIIALLKEKGATDIVVYNLKQVIV